MVPSSGAGRTESAPRMRRYVRSSVTSEVGGSRVRGRVWRLRVRVSAAMPHAPQLRLGSVLSHTHPRRIAHTLYVHRDRVRPQLRHAGTRIVGLACDPVAVPACGSAPLPPALARACTYNWREAPRRRPTPTRQSTHTNTRRRLVGRPRRPGCPRTRRRLHAMASWA